MTERSDAPQQRTFMEDVRSTLEGLSKESYTGSGLVYAANKLLARWNAEAPRSETAPYREANYPGDPTPPCVAVPLGLLQQLLYHPSGMQRHIAVTWGDHKGLALDCVLTELLSERHGE